MYFWQPFKNEAMSQKEAIVKEVKALIKTDNILEVKKEFERLFNEYNSIFDKEKEEKLAAFVLDGDKPEYFTMPKDDFDHQMEAYQTQFKEKVKNATESKRTQEKKNYEIKQLLLAELKELVEKEDRISAAYDSFNDIKERWGKTGNIPQNHVKEMQHEYRVLNEEFYYKIQIYKELKQNDLKKNFEQKQDVIGRLKKLIDEENIKELEVLMRALLVEWDNIGPTFKEKWEEIKADFYGTYHALNDKIRAHYKQIRDDQKENLNKKRALIEKAKQILEEKAESTKQWQEITKKIKEIQEEWKTIGFVPAAYNQKVWLEFKSVGNEIFARKREFFGEIKDQQKEINKIKKELISKANSIIEEVKTEGKEDWNNATKKIISLQKDWKKAGSALRQEEQKLWTKFRKSCDEFFELKDNKNKAQREEEQKNFEAKNAVIEELKSFKPNKDQSKSIASIEALAKKYAEVGFVPFKKKEKQEADFQKAIAAAYKNAGVSKEEQQAKLFSQKIEQLKAGKNSLKSLEFERKNLRQDINKAKEAELQLENNLSFFTGDDSNPLIKKAKADYQQGVEKRELLDARMKQLNIEINAAKKVEKEALQSAEAEKENVEGE